MGYHPNHKAYLRGVIEGHHEGLDEGLDHLAGHTLAMELKDLANGPGRGILDQGVGVL